jgi:hypothetical protein
LNFLCKYLTRVAHRDASTRLPRVAPSIHSRRSAAFRRFAPASPVECSEAGLADCRSGNALDRAILPAREQLPDLLAELGQPAAALVEYEASLRSAPARLNSIDGAARAAEVAGQKEKAANFHDQLMALCGGSVPVRATSAKAAD